jgi:hypothetical protein
MANITLTIPDASIGRIVDGMCNQFNYSTMKQAAETKAQFAKRMLVEMVKNAVLSSEVQAAKVAAIDTVKAQVDAITIN